MKDSTNKNCSGTVLPGLDHPADSKDVEVCASLVDDDQDGEIEYRKRYTHCRNLMEKRELFRSMTEEEKDDLARRMASSEYLDLTCDWAFKYLFQSHPALLIMLLNDILQETISSIEFRNTELIGLEPNERKVIFDLLCKTSDDRLFLCEMQKAGRSDQRDRLFYLL